MTRIEEELRSQREVILKQNETIQFGFAQMDKRFESMQKQIDERFAAVDRRFEMVQKSMDTRFEMMQKNMDNRFEQVEKRFDDVNKKFTMMMWMTSAGFTIIATVITLLTIFAR
jgi:predicted transcriptional regulator